MINSVLIVTFITFIAWTVYRFIKISKSLDDYDE